MPVRPGLKKVLILGAGPIVIGQACEFDYSGTQGCRALRSLGIEVVLLNSNPATIMTDPEFADRTYIEPLRPEIAERIIERERPDALLPTLGGQTALNLAIALAHSGVLAKHNVQLIGASLDAIETAEDRNRFKHAMEAEGLQLPKSGYVDTVHGAVELAEQLGYPLVIRASFTLGGQGSGLVHDRRQLREVARLAIAQSGSGSILIEECLVGWKEFELEVMRDRADNVVIVCSIENFDPLGVHTGDSITVAPAQTLSDVCYQEMRDAALRVMRAIKVEAGGSNIQFAVHPDTGEMRIIEMNPRVSRSSALASKATGFPIAKIAALLAAGLTLDEIPNDITRKTPACFEPTLDYCVVKIPRWAFEKFRGADPRLGTRMKSVGEVMAIGRNFPEALLKGWRGLESGSGLLPGPAAAIELPGLIEAIREPYADRLRDLFRVLASGESPESVAAATGVDPWFLHQMKRITDLDHELTTVATRDSEAAWSEGLVYEAKRLGISDLTLADRLDTTEVEVRRRRHEEGILPVMKAVDTCGAEFAAETPYFYSTYEDETETPTSTRPRVIILGSGPNRIGQGLEFDYCCVQAALELKERGYDVLIVNSNPETVSTDYDISSRLYFEPLTTEDVLNVVEAEKPIGVIVQLGGQTPLKLARSLHEAGVPLWGTPFDGLDLAENRERFRLLIQELGLLQPPSLTAASPAEALHAARTLGYPVLVRPSYVLGGRGMRVVYREEELRDWLEHEALVSAAEPVLVDQFLGGALEVDVDAVADGETVLIGAVMEHIEEAGIHSGDSTCVIPPFTLGEETVAEVRRVTAKLAHALGVKGLLNVQFAVRNDEVFVLEANPRASRTVPFVSKAIGLPLARIAARVMAGERLADIAPAEAPEATMVSVKKPVLPFARFPGEDSLLGPEMKSTGEVMGRDMDFGRALAKAHLGSGDPLPDSGTVFLSLRDDDKRAITFMAKKLVELGYDLVATRGTARFLARNGVPCRQVFKVHEGRPNVVDMIESAEIQLVINTPLGRTSEYDEKAIRASAIAYGVPVITTVAGALAATSGIEAMRRGPLEVTALQERI
ncbi:MAG: carbamoyl-phosphate synthase large subunit [Candidatus Eisenbacteria bacterium]|uniref:Carbamoyl phosphate synthase large chain n=1 Tax=Eiseniibacteriota bacterium TaxID=2212470 RepID=A0A849SQ63_UNCEI|nr:carbamoyl-phosphate synthase large subunit [Candidatus Eisenbacteria bacterium]